MNLNESITKLNLSFKRNNFTPEEINDLIKKSTKPKEFYQEIAKKYLTFENSPQKTNDDAITDQTNIFEGQKLNAFKNILGKHINTKNKNKAAFIWRGSDFTEKIFTYRTLYSEVIKCSAGLYRLGIRKGDLVMIFMPNLPELVILMLACVRIGAIHALYHHSYSADSLAARIDDCKPKLLVTANASLTGKESNLKMKVDEAIMKANYKPEHCVVVERIHKNIHMKPLRDIWYHDLISDENYDTAKNVPEAEFSEEDIMFLVYTSTDLKEPKGLKFSSTGFLLWSYFSYTLLFDPCEDDVFWCTADISWIVGHAMKIYGPLMSGQTTLMFEDTIEISTAKRFYDICERFGVTKFYSTPSIFRSLMNAAHKKNIYREVHGLRLIATGGEKINLDLFEWVFKEIGHRQSPIINIYTVTEAGGALAGHIPGYSKVDLENVGNFLPGINGVLLDSVTYSEITTQGLKGSLFIKDYALSLCKGICGSKELYNKNFWKKAFGTNYFRIGDSAQLDENRNIYLHGRVDDIVHVGGKRVGIIEIESAMNKHSLVKESAIVTINDEKRGESLIAFCVLNKKLEESFYDQTVREIREKIIEEIGEVVLPDEIKFTRVIPKSPDGSILRDLLKNIALQM